MEINKILNADVLDIIFDGKNKDYGAYQLRKNYNKRLATALVSMGSILLLLFIGSVLANVLAKKKPTTMDVVQVVQLEKVDQPKELPPPPPPPPIAPPPLEHFRTEIFVPPTIVKDEDVKAPPPTIDQLDKAKIGTIKQDGVDDDKSIVAPLLDPKGIGNVVAPKIAEVDYNGTFFKVEKPAEFPGGAAAWKRFLERAMSNYPEKAVENGTQGMVTVQLVVDKDGSITNVKALNDPGDGLADYAVKIIKAGPQWIPAEQNGRKVTYQFKQIITFQLQ